jgi:hypothetical protein
MLSPLDITTPPIQCPICNSAYIKRGRFCSEDGEPFFICCNYDQCKLAFINIEGYNEFWLYKRLTLSITVSWHYVNSKLDCCTVDWGDFSELCREDVSDDCDVQLNEAIPFDVELDQVNLMKTFQ